MTEAPLVVGFGGSTGVASVSALLLRSALERVAARGARTAELLGPELARLPIYANAGPEPAPEAARLIETVRTADAVIIATPGYHGGMSGLVKNALDHLEALRVERRPYLDGRAVGVIVTAAGWQATGTALVAVRSAIHALRGWPTPFGVTVNTAEQRIAAGSPLPDAVDGGLRILCDQVMDFVSWRRSAAVAVP
jgi:FMN reductase